MAFTLQVMAASVRDQIKSGITRARESRNWTKRDLGAKSGFGEDAIGKWESKKPGAPVPELVNYIKLARTFKISLDDLLVGEETRVEQTERRLVALIETRMADLERRLTERLKERGL